MRSAAALFDQARGRCGDASVSKRAVSPFLESPPQQRHRGLSSKFVGVPSALADRASMAATAFVGSLPRASSSESTSVSGRGDDTSANRGGYNSANTPAFIFGHQRLGEQLTRQGSNAPAWDYKYEHYPCASPVDPMDMRLLKVEALFQNVLSFPRLPPRIHRFLLREGAYGGAALTVEALTATVEGLNARFGKELVLNMVMRCPLLFLQKAEDLYERADFTRSMLDLKPHDMYMILRKNPLLMVMDPSISRARFNRLHRVTPLSHEAVTVMVRKYPLVLNMKSENVEVIIERLRHLAYSRVTWQENFDDISPSLLAFFLRDHADLLLRLEYLALTGEKATWCLFNVFKPSNNLFAVKHRGYRRWLTARAVRKQMQAVRRQQREEEEYEGER